MKSHLLEESPAAIFLLHFAFYHIPIYFWGAVLKRCYFFLPPRLAQPSRHPRHRGLACITPRSSGASLEIVFT